MTARFSGEEVLKYTSGRLASGYMPDGVGSICTDTRQLIKGQWYLALSGENFDGHQFLGDAFAGGAIGCIVAERTGYAIGNPSFPIIAVEDPLIAYQTLAVAWRDKVDPIVMAITGSSGKTTTKEMCVAACSAKQKVHNSQLNENNQIGVPKTILSMPEDTQILILEMAMRASGEILELAEIGKPNIAIIVNAGSAHLGRLGSLENIIKAKCELLEKLDSKTGVAIIGEPTENLMKRVHDVFRGKTLQFDGGDIIEVAVTSEETQFKIKPAEVIFSVKAHGVSHVQDAWCAIMAARVAGIDDESIAAGLKQYNHISGRGNRITTASGVVIINEAYNANPESVMSSINVFLDNRVLPSKYKYVVLGNLAELGDTAEQIHFDLGKWLKDKKFSGLITIGDLAANIALGAKDASFKIAACKNRDEAETVLQPLMVHGASVLVKASHSARLDELVAHLAGSVVQK